MQWTCYLFMTILISMHAWEACARTASRPWHHEQVIYDAKADGFGIRQAFCVDGAVYLTGTKFHPPRELTLETRRVTLPEDPRGKGGMEILSVTPVSAGLMPTALAVNQQATLWSLPRDEGVLVVPHSNDRAPYPLVLPDDVSLPIQQLALLENSAYLANKKDGCIWRLPLDGGPAEVIFGNTPVTGDDRQSRRLRGRGVVAIAEDPQHHRLIISHSLALWSWSPHKQEPKMLASLNSHRFTIHTILPFSSGPWLMRSSSAIFTFDPSADHLIVQAWTQQHDPIERTPPMTPDWIDHDLPTVTALPDGTISIVGDEFWFSNAEGMFRQSKTDRRTIRLSPLLADPHARPDTQYSTMLHSPDDGRTVWMINGSGFYRVWMEKPGR